MKACSVCSVVKPATDFQVRRLSEDGRTAACRVCLKERDRVRYQKEKPKRREWYRKYSKTNGREVCKKSRGKWRKKNPEKRAAQVLLGSAVLGKKVLKPKNCSRCNATGRIHGHHQDYMKPLEVIWLCAACHKKEHQ